VISRENAPIEENSFIQIQDTREWVDKTDMFKKRFSMDFQGPEDPIQYLIQTNFDDWKKSDDF
jgi:hypothetical protein